MAVLGLGLDVVELERLDRVHRRHGDAFIRRICRDGECAERSGDAPLAPGEPTRLLTVSFDGEPTRSGYVRRELTVPLR